MQLQSQVPLVNSKYKTVLCRHWQTTGTCQIGIRCYFAHGAEELRKPTDPIQLNQQILQNPALLTLSGPVGLNNYKTIKCRYHELGICKYKEACHFSHGDQELRNSVAAAIQQNQQQQQYVQTSSQVQPQQQPQQSYSVQTDPQIQKQITIQQLCYIIQQLQQLMLTPENSNKIKTAQELLTAQNIQACSQILNEVINRTDTQKEERECYEKIISEAAQLAVNIMAQYQVQYQQQVQQQLLLQQQQK